jgi:hypothetical protein
MKPQSYKDHTIDPEKMTSSIELEGVGAQLVEDTDASKINRYYYSNCMKQLKRTLMEMELTELMATINFRIKIINCPSWK